MESYVNNRLTRQVHLGCDFGALSVHEDLTLDTLKAFIDEDWDWTLIMNHPNFNVRWLKELPDAPWDWQNMHLSHKFRMYWIQLFIEEPWNKRSLSARATIDDLKNFPEFEWNWEDVTCYSHVTPEQMMRNPEMPWDFLNLGFTDILEDEILFIRFFLDKFTRDNWVDFSQTVSWRVFRKNLDLPWIYNAIRLDPSFIESDLDIIRNVGVSLWNWEYLSRNVPLKYITKNLDLPWVGHQVSRNQTLKFHHVGTQIEWDYSFAPCQPKEAAILEWHSSNVIKRAWKQAISNPEYKMCRDRLSNEAKELMSVYING